MGLAMNKKKVTGDCEMFRIDTMIKKLSLYILLAVLGSCLWTGSGFAQTNAELQTAIDGGPADIRDFFDKYKNKASDLAKLDTSKLNEAISSVNGGVENLTSQLNALELTKFLDELSDIGDLNTSDLASALLYAISSQDSTLGQAITSALGKDFFENIEASIPGITDLLNDELSDIFGLAGDLEDLINTISDLFGGGGGSSILDTILAGGGSGSLGSILGGGSSSTALPSASPMTDTCDSNILIAMETRAWLEAQREITQNQNLIAKPDSVLEYTCFDQFLRVLAEEAENLFSENTSVWSGGSVALISDTDMDNALSELIGSAVNSYVRNNFSHSFLGGRGTDDYTPSAGILGGSYTCDIMDRVWKNAKCMNFSTRSEDGFWTFSQHEDNDPRTLPDVCAEEPKWDSYIQAVFESPAWKSSGYESEIEDIYEELAKYTEAGSCDNSRLIRTGLKMYSKGVETLDAVCLNPGCYYNGAGCTNY